MARPRNTARPWVKLWRRESGSFATLPLFARALAAELLKIVSEAGTIELGSCSPVDVIARRLGADSGDRRLLRKYLPMLIADGYLEHVGGVLRVSGWSRFQSGADVSRNELDANATEDDAKKYEDDANATRNEREIAAKSAESLNTDPRAGTENPSLEVEVEEEVEVERETPPPADPQPRRDVLRVFEHWRSALGKTAAAKLDDKRRRRIEWALKAYGLDDTLRAIDGCARSDWHMGRDPRSNGQRFDDLTLILRDATHIERFLGFAGPPAPRVIASTPALTDADRARRRAERLREIDERNARISSGEGT